MLTNMSVFRCWSTKVHFRSLLIKNTFWVMGNLKRWLCGIAKQRNSTDFTKN
ncbi:hypothetical protein X975_25631, partial [Stegodyphus mimosarum]